MVFFPRLEYQFNLIELWRDKSDSLSDGALTALGRLSPQSVGKALKTAWKPDALDSGLVLMELGRLKYKLASPTIISQLELAGAPFFPAWEALRRLTGQTRFVDVPQLKDLLKRHAPNGTSNRKFRESVVNAFLRIHHSRGAREGIDSGPFHFLQSAYPGVKILSDSLTEVHPKPFGTGVATHRRAGPSWKVDVADLSPLKRELEKYFKKKPGRKPQLILKTELLWQGIGEGGKWTVLQLTGRAVHSKEYDEDFRNVIVASVEKEKGLSFFPLYDQETVFEGKDSDDGGFSVFEISDLDRNGDPEIIVEEHFSEGGGERLTAYDVDRPFSRQAPLAQWSSQSEQ